MEKSRGSNDGYKYFQKSKRDGPGFMFSTSYTYGLATVDNYVRTAATHTTDMREQLDKENSGCKGSVKKENGRYNSGNWN